VPYRIAKNLRWNSSGTITETRDPDHRMVFTDVDALNQLFANIEGLIGISIQNIITESKARATQDFTKQLIRGWKGSLVRKAGLKIVINKMGGVARSFGYGDIDVLYVDWDANRIGWRLHDPYSVPLMCGDLRGATEAVRNVVGTVEPEMEDPRTWIMRGRLSPPPDGMEERLAAPAVRTRPGDITYQRCETCGVPRAMGGFDWDMEHGIITYRKTGVRYAFVGPAGIQAIFDELASELGGSIPETIIEAQRMHTESQSFEPWAEFDISDFRSLLGVMGYGNLHALERTEGGVSAKIDNASLPLMIVGTALGAYEILAGKKAQADWSCSPDGELLLKL
jgi:hypothetical protein